MLEICNTVFNEWFYNFEFPNEKGEAYKSSGGQMKNSNFGKIPINWIDGSLSMIIDETNDRIKNEKSKAIVMSPIKTGQLVKSENFFTKRVHSEDISKYKKIQYLDFAYNPARANIGSIGILTEDITGAVSPVYVTFRAKKQYHWFVSMLIKQANIKQKIIQYSSGSVRQALKYDSLAGIKVVIPDEETIEKFSKFYDVLDVRIKQNQKEIETLTKLRDTLLPKLMNGEIELENIEI